MKQVFCHYETWEDYKAGMFVISDVKDKDKKVISAISLLSDESEFSSAIKRVFEEWPIASSVNMTNKQQNRRAWIGAAACMLACGTPEFLTRIAWNLLNKETQDAANKIAELFIANYENQTNHGQTLFG